MTEKSLNKSIRTDLVEAMKSGEYADCAHLPRESVLAERLGISRTQLRDILASLEQEGFITRRHGIGTLINHHVLKVPVRADIEIEFQDMIRRSGYEAGVESVRACVEPSDNQIAQQLQLEPGEPVTRVERVCTADGNPAIYCEDFVAERLIKGSYTEKDLQLPIFYFLRHCCDAEVHLDLTEIHPVVADRRLAEIFRIAEGQPLLYLEELDYDISGHPVLCSRQYFIDGVFHHTVLRKRL